MPRWRSPSLWLVPVLLAASCSSGGGGDGTDGDAGGSLEGQQVEVAATWSGTDQERFSAVLAKFEEHTGAKVTFTSTGDDIATVLDARLEGGQPPGVALLPRVGFVGDLASRGLLKPLRPATADLVARNYDPVWRELGTVNGQLFGVWFRAVNKSTLWFNRTVLDRAHIRPPTTWDELQAAAAAVAGAGLPPISVGAADAWTLTDWFENVYLRSAGSEAYIDLARHHLAWDDPTVVTALNLLAEVFRTEWLAGGREGALQTGFISSVAGVFADPPKAAFVLEAGPVQTAGQNAGVAEFPSIGGSPPSAVVGGDAAVLLADTPAGQALVEFLATPEAAEEWARLGGFTSPNKNVDTAAYRTDVERRAAEALVGAQVVRFDMSDLQPADFGSDPDRGLWPLFREYLANPAGAVDVTRRLEQLALETFEP